MKIWSDFKHVNISCDSVMILELCRYEPLADLLGQEYFLHAYGPIYALSADVVTSLVALKKNR